MSFIARRIALAYEGHCPPGKQVYTCEEVARLRDIAAVVARARRAACAMIEEARETARQVGEQALAARRARECDAESGLVARARALEELYRLAHASLTAQLETTLDRALDAALTHIGAALPAQQRLSIVCEQLKLAAGPARGARLRLCEADASAFRTECGAAYDAPSAPPARAIPWPTEIDDTLKQGHCVLVTEYGEWVLDFDALIASFASERKLDKHARAAAAAKNDPYTGRIA